MTATQIFDVEQLLAPISEEQPTGVELSMSEPQGYFQRIKDAFDDARKLVKEKQDRDISGGVDSFGNPWRQIPEADWQPILTLGEEILRHQSKDFRVAAWMTEALLRKHHLLGLRDGLRLCLGLCERYWSAIHPGANEEDGHSATVAAFNSLVAVPEQSMRIDIDSSAILSSPVVRGIKPGERSVRSYSTLDYYRSKELDQLTNPDERARRVELGHITRAEFLEVAANTEPGFIAENLEAVTECITICGQLGDFFRDNCLPDEYGEETAPGLYDFREQLDSVRRLLTELAGDSSEKDGPETELVDNASAGGTVTAVRPQEMTRESALQTVEKVAQFFERTEPHSPVYFALRQVVRWGRMPFPELLSELINDENVMYQLRKQIGLPERKESE
jgi:type VI secretion system protein ImpA